MAAQINQMATIETMGSGASAEAFDTRCNPDDGQWLLATYNLRDAHFFHEFYYDRLPATARKDFIFLASSPNSVDDLAVEVQAPAPAGTVPCAPAGAPDWRAYP